MKHNWKRNENGNVDEWAWEDGFHNGVFCVDCGKVVCVCCNPDYMELDDCAGPSKKPKIITNADRIRAMSDEELADFIDDWWCAGANGDESYATHEARLAWLQALSKEDT